ncbi:hypothetical protein [Yoonia sp. 2307UL14-13]|uniref:hypothetical protein n=1 Tax=Yoonia sp. 2307UL14-13 TaxID=3126506 RepID=UPI0030A7B646
MTRYEMYLPKSSVASAVCEEFNQLGDLIWKLPSFLTFQRDIERKKLDAYFPEWMPGSDKMRALRATFEGSKLDLEFPRFLNQTGVLLSIALYEARFIQSVNSICRPSKPTDALKASWDVLGHYGFTKEQLRFAQQVDVALQVRHSLIHFSGYIDRLRKRDELKLAIEKKHYLQEWQKEQGSEDETAWLAIEPDTGGDRLVISHTYSFGICALLRDNLCDLIDKLDAQMS